MAKDGFMTAKAIGNRIKAKGLQKLRWFCQICEKQCRDENGFKCHVNSESHQRKMLLVAESPEKFIDDYSAEFQAEFMKLLSTRYGTRRVHANLVYQEFIADREHSHMNATKWTTLSEFTMHLGKEGLAIVDETPKGWFMQWVDNSPKTLARQEAILKKERMEMDDEQREQKLIQQQIEKALALKQQQDEADGVTTELVRENEEEKIKLDISIKPVSLGGLGGGIKLGGGAGGGLLKPKSLNALAAKKPNPFSSKASPTVTATSATTSGSSNGSTAPLASTTAPTKKRSPVEEIMEREMAKKKRLEELNNRSQQQQSNAGRTQEPEKDRSRDLNREDRDRDYRPSRDSRESRDNKDRERDYRSSRDENRDDRDRDRDYSRSSRDDRDRDYRSSRDDQRDKDNRSSRDSRDDRDRDRDRNYGSRSDRDYRDRERDRDRDRDSYRDRGRD
ncbi:hypothetical protein BGX23_007132 [Mortierella sp. AD031]|nr:hypothetical protein BGX23_007132 [Mortierella sp. AD031]KAG0198821.1 hypothetical protein BGX33_012057 [Mortierella sp. NVP41]